MKVYIVYTGNYYNYNENIIKGFTDLEKAIEFAVDVVMKKTHKYNQDYVEERIRNGYAKSNGYVEPIRDLFVYTDYYDMEYDRFVGIMDVDID